MNTLESRDRLDKLNIEELKKVYYLCRLKQLDDEMEEIRWLLTDLLVKLELLFNVHILQITLYLCTKTIAYLPPKIVR